MMNVLHEPTEKASFLGVPAQDRLLRPERTEAQLGVSVTTLFATDAAHEEAQRFTQFLSEKLGADLELQVRHWSYGELQHLRAGKVAAELAQQTDILLLVTHADELLPPAVARWIAKWLLQARSSCAAVCLVGSGDRTVESAAARHLRRACEAAQVQFFASGFTASAPRQRRSSIHRSGSDGRFEAFGIMHWGINE